MDDYTIALPRQIRFAPQEETECETIVIFNDAVPGVVHVWTSQHYLARQLLRDHPGALVEHHTDDQGRTTGLEFALPAECVRIRGGKQPRSRRQQAALEAARARSRIARLPVRPLTGEGAEESGGAETSTGSFPSPEALR